MLIITLGILVALGIGSSVFWGKLRNWLNDKLRPWLTRRFGETVGEKFGDFLFWLDDKIVLTRLAFRTMWRFFKERVLRMKRTYTANPNNTVTNEGETIVINEHGNVVKITETVIENWEDLPGNIRREMIRQNTNTAQIDEMAEIFEPQVRKYAEAAGFSDEMVMEH